MATNKPAEAAVEKPRVPAARHARPNYNLLHRNPLPLKIDALPPLIPHNPLSLLTIAWVYVRSILRPAKQPTFQGVLSPETRSVHVTDKVAIRALWENGFFGKGTLSRSEPSWLDREKKRLGLIAADTSEEVTRRRRQERAEFKKERARKEREEIEATLRRERAGLSGELESQPLVANGHDADAKAVAPANEEVGSPVEKRTSQAAADVPQNSVNEHVEDEVLNHEEEIADLEHLQLTFEEALFLSFGLGVLDVYALPHEGGSGQQPIPREQLFQLFQSQSLLAPGATAISTGQTGAATTFLANYAVYHHFRSLGWVVRPGVKFAVDWMIYHRGPVFSHAEFAVIIVPSFSAAGWKTKQGQEHQESGKSWHWLHMVNRVQSQVRKTLLLAFVEMPPPELCEMNAGADPVSILSSMKVREVVLKRWIPNRNRD